MGFIRSGRIAWRIAFAGLAVTFVIFVPPASAATATLLDEDFDRLDCGRYDDGKVGALNVIGGVDVVSGNSADVRPCFPNAPRTPTNTSRYVDLDGNVGGGANLRDKLEFEFPVTAGGNYVLTFDLAGNQKDAGEETVFVEFGPSHDEFFRDPLDDFASNTLAFVAESGGSEMLRFTNNDDNGIGALLDNVRIIETTTEPTLPTVSIADTRVDEGDKGRTKLTFKVELSESSSTTVRVGVRTQNGSAMSNDFDARQAVLEFAPGEMSKNFAVRVRGDEKVEDDETFSAKLSKPENATLSQDRRTGTGTVVNDD